MIQFAIYYIPSDLSFYNKGTKVVGYEINSGEKVSGFFNNTSNIFGFHLTLTDVVGIDVNKFNTAIRRAELIFKFPYFRNIKLKKNKIDYMPNADVLAIQYKKSFRLLLLHVLLVIFVQKLGTVSPHAHTAGRLTSIQKIKMRIFLSPYIFNDFFPHITLVSNPTPGSHDHIKNSLTQLFDDHQGIFMDHISVVTKQECLSARGGGRFSIYKKI